MFRRVLYTHHTSHKSVIAENTVLFCPLVSVVNKYDKMEAKNGWLTSLSDPKMTLGLSIIVRNGL